MMRKWLTALEAKGAPDCPILAEVQGGARTRQVEKEAREEFESECLGSCGPQIPSLPAR